MRARIVLNCFLLVICAFLFHTTFSFSRFVSFAGVNTPEFWPRVILVMIAAIAIISLVREFVNWKKGAKEEPGSKVNYKKFILAVTLAVLYFLSMQYIGFIPATLIFQCAFLFLQEVRNVYMLVLTPLALTTLVYVLFIHVMSIILPRGVGPFWTFSLFFY